MSTRGRRVATLLGAATFAVSSQGAFAQGKSSAPSGGAAARKKANTRQSSVDAKALQEALRSDASARMLDALATAKASGADAAQVAPAIEDVLKRGATLDIMVAAVEALGAIGAPSSSAVLRPYARHRAEELRRAAVRALARTKGADAIAALKEALRGPDAVARSAAATGLGNVGAADALPELFSALGHDVTEAAAAIGQVCMPDDCNRFADVFLGKQPFEVVAQGFDKMLFRASPLPEDTAVRLVARVRDLGTPEAAKYLAGVRSRWPTTGSQKVKDALDAAVSALPHSGEAAK